METQKEYRKPDCFKERFESMAAAAKLASGGAKAFTPKDLELFEASEFQKASCFRGYDKITVNPRHAELPKWELGTEVFARIGVKRV
jgi:hypothetical protein